MAKVNERISSEQFYEYIRRFGFGEKSLIDLPGEHPGGIRHPKDWSALSHDSLTMGQGNHRDAGAIGHRLFRPGQRRLAVAATSR